MWLILFLLWEGSFARVRVTYVDRGGGSPSSLYWFLHSANARGYTGSVLKLDDQGSEIHRLARHLAAPDHDASDLIFLTDSPDYVFVGEESFFYWRVAEATLTENSTVIIPWLMRNLDDIPTKFDDNIDEYKIVAEDLGDPSDLVSHTDDPKEDLPYILGVVRLYRSLTTKRTPARRKYGLTWKNKYCALAGLQIAVLNLLDEYREKFLNETSQANATLSDLCRLIAKDQDVALQLAVGLDREGRVVRSVDHYKQDDLVYMKGVDLSIRANVREGVMTPVVYMPHEDVLYSLGNMISGRVGAKADICSFCNPDVPNTEDEKSCVDVALLIDGRELPPKQDFSYLLKGAVDSKRINLLIALLFQEQGFTEASGPIADLFTKREMFLNVDMLQKANAVQEAATQLWQRLRESNCSWTFLQSSYALIEDPDTLAYLISLKESLIGPALTSVGEPLMANFFTAINEGGLLRDPLFHNIVAAVEKTKEGLDYKGILQVPSVTDALLMNKSLLRSLEDPFGCIVWCKDSECSNAGDGGCFLIPQGSDENILWPILLTNLHSRKLSPLVTNEKIFGSLLIPNYFEVIIRKHHPKWRHASHYRYGDSD